MPRELDKIYMPREQAEALPSLALPLEERFVLMTCLILL